MSRIKDFISDVENALWTYNFDVEKVSEIFGVSVKFIQPICDDLENDFVSRYENEQYDQDYYEGGL